MLTDELLIATSLTRSLVVIWGKLSLQTEINIQLSNTFIAFI